MVNETIKTPIPYYTQDKHGSIVQAEMPVIPLKATTLVTLPIPELMPRLKTIVWAYGQPAINTIFQIGKENHPQTREEIPEIAQKVVAHLYDYESKNHDLERIGRKREVAKSKYQADKLEIKRRKVQVDKKLRETETNWGTKSQAFHQEQEATVHLRDNAIDIFTRDLFAEKEGPQDLILATQTLDDLTPLTEKDVVDYLKIASNRVRKMDDKEFVEIFQYKLKEENPTLTTDISMLQTIVKTAFSEEKKGENATAKSVRSLAQTLIDKYYRSCTKLSAPTDQTPHLAFLYDIVFASTVDQNLTTLDKATNYMWGKMKKNSETISHEYLILLNRHFNEHAALLQEIEERTGQSNIWDLLLYIYNEGSREEWNPKNRGAISVSKYADRELAMRSLGMYATSIGLPNLFYSWEKNFIRSEEDNKLVTHYSGLFNAFDRLMFENFSDVHNPSLSIIQMMDSDTYRSTIASYSERPEKPPIAKAAQQGHVATFLKKISDIHKMNRKVATSLTHSIVLDIGLQDNLPLKADELKLLIERNDLLTEAIRDQNIWFVAEQGDQFALDTDPALEQYNIRTVTFHPDHSSQGQKISIESLFTDEDKNPIVLDYILDRNGNLRQADGTRLNVSLYTQEQAKKILLERLFFITSGALSRKKAETKDPGELIESVDELDLPEQNEQSHRSHWRYYKSVPEKRYTFTSYGARKHQEYVKRIYGIDILQENTRRRAVKTLGADEFMTFVKAHVAPGAKPNELAYDPAYVEDFFEQLKQQAFD